ncbi:MAG: TonB-dependent receptor [Campylobacterota bacterium]|nr:TonB-dependent receptor [Campylobacterota bacterium]
MISSLLIRSCLSLSAIAVVASANTTDFNTSAEKEQLGSFEVVDSKENYRFRTDSVSPTLVYDREFFERYEPVTAGAMLKRVPGVVFQGDIGEYDFIKLRGMAAGYTQILINGKRVPGVGSDGEMNLDRIPAEMVDRIEIVRSPSAELDSQGVAGTINIILKDGESMKGGYYRIGASRHSNGNDNPWTETKYKPNVFLSYSDVLDTFSYTVSGYYQERYNAKEKITNEHEDGHDDKDSWVYTEDEWDNRESKDSSLSTKFDIDVAESGTLSLSGNYFHTDREEEQYEFKTERDSVDEDFKVDKLEHQIKDIEQESYNFTADYTHDFDSSNQLVLSASFDNFNSTLDEYEAKNKKADSVDEWTTIANIHAVDHDGELTNIDDTEIKGAVGYKMGSINHHTIKFGLQAQNKKRDTSFSEYEQEDGIVSDPETVDFGTHKIDQNRIDGYLEDTWVINNRSSLQVGGRLEYTKVSQEGTEANVDNDYVYFNPSIHYKFGITQQDQFRVSFAQTLRRPNFDEMVPFEADDEPEDYDVLIGNPELTPEKALGFDIGYEHAFAGQYGIVGANIFYRNVQDKIELSRTGDNEVEDDGEIETGGIYTPDNVGDGEVCGIELDAGFPLSFIGVPSVSFFANYSYLDSKIEDPFTKKERRFNDQPDYVYNLGLSHSIKTWGMSYGFSYQKRGDSTYEDSVTTETTSYDANLEAYIEYKMSDALVLRFTGDNLLDADVTEHMTNYKSLDDKISGDVDTYETQIERAGAVFMLTLSGRF